MQTNSETSKIIILCGGRGKRLGNITSKIPKPLIKVGKISIIGSLVVLIDHRETC